RQRLRLEAPLGVEDDVFVDHGAGVGLVAEGHDGRHECRRRKRRRRQPEAPPRRGGWQGEGGGAGNRSPSAKTSLPSTWRRPPLQVASIKPALRPWRLR